MDTQSQLNNSLTTEEVIEGSHGGPYMVEKIVGVYMGKDHKKYFRVKWLDSWEPAENLSEGCQKLIDEFWSGTANAANPVSTDNLLLGQKIIKTEVMDHPEVVAAGGMSSGSGLEQRGNVSASNDVPTSSGKKKKSSSKQNRNTQATNPNRNTGTAKQNRNATNQSKNTSSTNQNRNAPPTNQAKNSPATNLNRNAPAINQNRNAPAGNMNWSACPSNQNWTNLTANQNRGAQLANQLRIVLAQEPKNTTKKHLPKSVSKNKKGKAPNEAVPSMNIHNDVTVTSSTVNLIENTNTNINTDLSLVDQKADLRHQSLIPEMSPKTKTISSPRPAHVQTSNLPSTFKESLPPNVMVMPSPQQQKVETSSPTHVDTPPLTSLDSHHDEKHHSLGTPVPDDDVENDSKLNVTHESPVKSDLSPSAQHAEPTSSTSLPTSLTPPQNPANIRPPSSRPSPSPSKRATTNEVISSSTTLLDINTGPIKMASPTSVIPVEATSTIQDDVDLGNAIKVSSPSPPNAKKQLVFNNAEFVLKTTTEETSSVEAITQSHDIQTYDDGSNDVITSSSNLNSLPRPPFKDRHNVLHSSPPPYFSDIPDSDYDLDTESLHGNHGIPNNFTNIDGYGTEIEKYGTEMENYEDENDEDEQINLMNYNDEVSGNQMNNFRNNVENNFVSLDGDDEENNDENTDYTDEFDRERWGDANQYNEPIGNPYDEPMGNQYNEPMGNQYNEPMGNQYNEPMGNQYNEPMGNQYNEPMGNQYNEPMGNQYNEPMLGGYDSQPEDVIALDSDDDENDDLEIIVSIDSPQNRRHSRLPTSLQKSRQPNLPNASPNNPGNSVSQRGSRGRGRATGRGNRGRNVTNTQVIEQASINHASAPPLVHPRLLLNSPQTQPDETVPSSPRRKRGNKSGGRGGRGSRGGRGNNSRSNNVVVNTETSPPKPNQKTIVVSKNSAFTTPTRKRQRAPPQPSFVSGAVLSNDTTPPQNKAKRTQAGNYQLEGQLGNSPSSDYSPSRAILNDRTCTICNHAFPNLTLARQHAKQVHANQYGSPTSTATSLTCQVCKAMFKNNKELKSHMLLHGNLNLHKCEVCFRAFKQRSVLMQHLLIHTDELPYACAICDKRFRQQGHLILHLGKHGRNNEGTYTCPHCSVDFSEEATFAEHMKEHDAELPFKCNFCQQRFEMKSNLMLHLEGHNEGRPFTCHICKKSFKKKNYYYGHMQMHKIRDNQNNIPDENEEGSEAMEDTNYIKN